MKLIKEIYDETETSELIERLEMLRKNGVVFKSYEGCEDLSDELDETFYYEYVEYVLDDSIRLVQQPKYDTMRIESDYRLGKFDLARVYLRNWED